MEAKRTELAPILLFGFSALVLTTSLFAYLCGQAALQQSVELDIDESIYPVRQSELLYWPAPDFVPVNLNSLPKQVEFEFNNAQSNSLLEIKASSFFIGENKSYLAVNADDLSFDPLAEETSNAGRFIVYLPAQPKLSAVSPRYISVLTKSEIVSQTDWKIFGWDSLATIKQSGSWWTSNVTTRFNQRVALTGIKKIASATFKSPTKLTPDIAVLPLDVIELNAAKPIESASKIYLDPLTIRSYLLQGTKGTLFPVPIALADQLDRLANNQETSGWAWSLAYRLKGLTHTSEASSDSIQRALRVIANAAEEATQQAEIIEDQQVATELRRARYAIDRRVASWQSDISRRNQLISVNKNRKIRGLETFGVSQLEELRFAMRGDVGKVLPRIELGSPLERQPLTMAAKIEAFELAPSAERANDIALKMAMLGESTDPTDRQLASAINDNYRNANVRVAISQNLIERLYGSPTTKSSVVNDRIAGRPVRGTSQTQSKVSIRTIPDENAWRLGINAAGTIQSDTVSFGGPAKLRTVGKTNFNAKKNLTIDFNGVKVQSTRVNANRESSKLVGVKTKYDRVPMMGSYARSTAKKEYAKARGRVKQEIERKTEARIRTTIDQKTDPAIEKLQTRYREVVLDRADRLGLEVDPIELRTTDSRLIGRLRLANGEQLASHTPRMRAPSDSLLSVQLHESAINNAIEGLQLGGNKFTNLQLHQRIQDRFAVATDVSRVDPSNRVTLTFKEHDAARINFQEGKVQLTMALDRMSIRGKNYNNIKVHTIYVPQVINGKAWLVQEGSAQIEGKLRTSSRLRLHASLGKVLGEGRRIPVGQIPTSTDSELSERMEGIATTQFVIEDGWLGLALGPKRSAKLAVRVGSYVR